MLEQETCEIRVHAFISGDKFVGIGESWHETALLEPEDSCECSGKEDAFHSSECDKSLSEGCGIGLDPS